MQWPGVTIEEIRLQAILNDETLTFERNEVGELMRVVTDVNGEQFAEMWLDRVGTFSYGDAEPV